MIKVKRKKLNTGRRVYFFGGHVYVLGWTPLPPPFHPKPCNCVICARHKAIELKVRACLHAVPTGAIDSRIFRTWPRKGCLFLGLLIKVVSDGITAASFKASSH